ncbi:MAG: hypothetical protein ACLR8Y_09310 [Alistipes indistinctus]
MKRLTLTSVFALLFTGLSILSLRGAEPELDLAPARWIWYPSQRTLSNTMLMLRKEFTLDSVPEKVSGWILADSRYRLWVNGQRVQWGPAPADPRWPGGRSARHPALPAERKERTGGGGALLRPRRRYVAHRQARFHLQTGGREPPGSERQHLARERGPQLARRAV